MTDGRGNKLDFGLGRVLDNVDGIATTIGTLHEQVVIAVQQAFGQLEEEAVVHKNGEWKQRTKSTLKAAMLQTFNNHFIFISNIMSTFIYM